MVFPLLAGLFLLMVGNGLQGTLLGLRADAAEFPVAVTGTIMSLHYVGFLIGCLLAPRLIAAVGHIRVFAALACIAAPVILLHGFFVVPWVWAIVRIISGISFAGLFIVVESWLNSTAVNHLRGRIYGFYFLCLHGGLFIGQFLIGLAPVESMGLFILISTLISFSVVPLTLADRPAPGYQQPAALSFRKLIKTSPLSLMSVFTTGFCASSMFTLGTLYALGIGFTPSQAAMLMACYILGCATIPLATGWLSDKIDRRKMLIVLGLTATAVAIAINVTGWVYPLAFIFGGTLSSIYSIGVSYMNDQLKPDEMVSASTALILLNGAGSVAGPFIIGLFLQWYGPQSFFTICAICTSLYVLFSLYRAWAGSPVIVDEQKPFVPLPARSATTPLDILQED
ncbi:MAG: MFS transporter [Alphaproteobacteria bacterium]|nr:MFS transporter [Alphaproteobacteria bacterium]MCD8571716.1 MFS transporter [Alphaproteobacteria bacterium]